MFHFDENRVYALRFAAAVGKKKKKQQRSLALDTRFGRNNAVAKRPGMKNCVPEGTQGRVIQKFDCATHDHFVNIYTLFIRICIYNVMGFQN